MLIFAFFLNYHFEGVVVLAKGSFFSRFINKYWVTNQHVPRQVVQELQLDLQRPIVYVVQQNSASDLLGLQASCLQAGLPDPYQSIQVAGQTLSATIFIDDWSLFAAKSVINKNARYLLQYQQLLNLHKNNPALDIQLVPVTFYWGRNPGRQGKNSCFDLLGKRRVGAVHKSLVVLKNAKDHLVRFNQPISIAALCKRDQSVQQQAEKLARLAIRYFGQQKRSSVGPKLPNRQQMIDAILVQPDLQQVIRERATAEGRSEQQITLECRKYLQEISANFSYTFLRIFRKLLGWVWNHIYQGVEVNHAQAVRQASQSGAEIIYMPCHRSHMDYLLLSYLLFEQGLIPPHVAAGVNLNFFPAGAVFRRSGAFFLRRTFKGSPLYAQVFKAYFSMLFAQGYPIEFFTEGGRSRTGRLLPPKTGLLASSLQTYLNQPDRNVLIIPVYIGYDHIMEVATYTKELNGQKKQKESFWQVLGIVKKLGNFGRAFVNFGEPINIKQYFAQEFPDGHSLLTDDELFKKQVQKVANNVMTGINAATAVNALPLCAAILLASKDFQLQKVAFFEHIAKHQQLLALLCENGLVTYAQDSAADIYQQALLLNKFSEHDAEVVCSPTQASQLSYYRNNIIHLFALPSLLCNTVRYLLWQNKPLTFANIADYAGKVYPLLEAEYFLQAQQDTASLLENGLQQLQKIGVLRVDDAVYQISDEQLFDVFAGHLKETFLRYQVLLSLLLAEAKNWQEVDAKQLASLCKAQLKISSIEPFDEKVVKVFLQALQKCYPDFIRQEQGKVLLGLFYHSF